MHFPRHRARALGSRTLGLGSQWKRIELLGRLKSFLADYQEALQVWREGLVEPVFPSGTYLMRVAHGVACASA
jgi:REP-associated tyrosine transposase